MPYPELKALLTDIGTEELGHLEMVGTIVHQLTRDLTEEQIRTAGFDTYFVDRTAGVLSHRCLWLPLERGQHGCERRLNRRSHRGFGGRAKGSCHL